MVHNLQTAGDRTAIGQAPPERRVDRLPVAALLAFAMTGFIAILTETMPAGLLPQISDGLHVAETAAGQLVTAYAAGSLLAALPLTAATQGWRRRPVLLAAVAGLLVFNTVTALSGSFVLTLGARFCAGVAAGLAWGMIAGYARQLVPTALQGRALALAMVGTPVALSLGVPLATLLGTVAGWRAAFGVASALALLLGVWVLWAVPDRPGQDSARRVPVLSVFRAPGIRPVLFVILAWMGAHNVLYTYVAPFVASAGLGGWVDLVLAVFGVAALVGIWGTGLLVDRWLRALVLGSLAAFAAAAAVLLAAQGTPAIILGAVAVWGLSFGGAATLLGTAGADAAGDGVDVAQAMNTTAWNMAIAGGGVAGAFLLNNFGTQSLPWAVLAFLAPALAVAWSARAHGFRPGPRAAP